MPVPSAENRARLAVDDLERSGGFSRSVLVVATTTGSGWIDPASPDTLEYLTGGDTATVTMQYSYLPSWLSYLVDQDRVPPALPVAEPGEIVHLDGRVLGKHEGIVNYTVGQRKGLGVAAGEPLFSVG